MFREKKRLGLLCVYGLSHVFESVCHFHCDGGTAGRTFSTGRMGKPTPREQGKGLGQSLPHTSCMTVVKPCLSSEHSRLPASLPPLGRHPSPTPSSQVWILPPASSPVLLLLVSPPHSGRRDLSKPKFESSPSTAQRPSMAPHDPRRKYKFLNAASAALPSFSDVWHIPSLELCGFLPYVRGCHSCHTLGVQAAQRGLWSPTLRNSLLSLPLANCGGLEGSLELSVASVVFSVKREWQEQHCCGFNELIREEGLEQSSAIVLAVPVSPVSASPRSPPIRLRLLAATALVQAHRHRWLLKCHRNDAKMKSVVFQMHPPHCMCSARTQVAITSDSTDLEHSISAQSPTGWPCSWIFPVPSCSHARLDPIERSLGPRQRPDRSGPGPPAT